MWSRKNAAPCEGYPGFEHGSPSSVAPFSSSCPSQKRLEKFPHREQRESGMRVMSTSLAPAVLRVCSFCSKFLPGTKIPGSARRVQHLQVQQIASVGHSGCIQIYNELIPADLQTSEGKLIISNSETAALRKWSLGKCFRLKVPGSTSSSFALSQVWRQNDPSICKALHGRARNLQPPWVVLVSIGETCSGFVWDLVEFLPVSEHVVDHPSLFDHVWPLSCGRVHHLTVVQGKANWSPDVSGFLEWQIRNKLLTPFSCKCSESAFDQSKHTLSLPRTGG